MPTTTKPLVPADWTSAQPTQIAQPPSSLQASGFTAGQRPTYQHLNFLLYNIGQWISWLDQNANGAVSTLEIQQSMRLVTSAVWSYSAASGTLAWSDVFALSTPSIANTQNTVAAGSVSIQPGQVAYVVANLPFATTANITSGSTSLTNVSYEVGIVVGQTVSGNGIAAGTSVVAISGTTVTMSNPATASSSASVITFVGNATLSVQVANVANLQPAPNVIIIASVTPMYAIVGVNSGQMRLYDGEQKRLLNSGFVHTFMTQAGSALTAGQVVYVSPGGNGGDFDAIQATTTSGSTTLTNVSSTANIMPGCIIVGTGMAANTTVTAVGASSLSLSNAATSSGTAVSLQSQRIPGAVYPADTSRFWGLIRGNATGVVTTTPVISQTAASMVRYVCAGTFPGYTGLTPGALYYADPTTPGGITTSVPSSAVYGAPVGVAVSATSLYVQPLTTARVPTSDSIFNDVVVQPISGSSNAVGVKVVNNQQATQFSVDNAGNVVSLGALSLLGAATIQGAVSAPTFTSAAGFKCIGPTAYYWLGSGTPSYNYAAMNIALVSQAASQVASYTSFAWVAPRSGSVTALSVRFDRSNSIGFVFRLNINGTPTAQLLQLTANGSVTFPKGLYPFTANQTVFIECGPLSGTPSVVVTANCEFELGA